MKGLQAVIDERMERDFNEQRDRATRAELALLKIGLATNERATYEAVAAFFNVKVGDLWTFAKIRGASK